MKVCVVLPGLLSLEVLLPMEKLGYGQTRSWKKNY